MAARYVYICPAKAGWRNVVLMVEACLLSQMKLAIFRTSNFCGWGVKTLEPIPVGTFVMEYVGEVRMPYQI